MSEWTFFRSGDDALSLLSKLTRDTTEIPLRLLVLVLKNELVLSSLAGCALVRLDRVLGLPSFNDVGRNVWFVFTPPLITMVLPREKKIQRRRSRKRKPLRKVDKMHERNTKSPSTFFLSFFFSLSSSRVEPSEVKSSDVFAEFQIGASRLRVAVVSRSVPFLVFFFFLFVAAEKKR